MLTRIGGALVDVICTIDACVSRHAQTNVVTTRHRPCDSRLLAFCTIFTGTGRTFIDIIVAVITGPLVVLMSRFDRRNTEQHDRNMDELSRIGRSVDKVGDKVDRLDDRLDSHVEWHVRNDDSA